MLRALASFMVCLGCSNTPSTGDASTDSSNESSAIDSGGGDASSTTCDANVAFEYQYPDASPRSGCLALNAENVAVHLVANDAGSCEAGAIIDTNPTAETTDFSLVVSLIAQSRALFADAGATTVRVQLKDGNMLFDTTSESCAFDVTIAGHDGQDVAGTLTAPCTMPTAIADASPGQATMLALTIRGTVSTFCP